MNMLRPEDLDRLRDMLEYARRVEQHVPGVSHGDFERDEGLQTKVVHWVQIIGEAARNVSPTVKKEHPEIPWVDIVGMRHKIVHGYRSVDLEKVWQTVTTDIPHLITTLSNLLL
jgi:uncharacterized protein with HEPN domain